MLHKKYLITYVVLLLLIVVYGAPRSSSKSSLVYDQKQTGEYNIQLHLKDFQVIAILSGDALGDIGDYDYNYDYGDLTIRPPVSSSTNSSEKPSNITSSSPHRPAKPPTTTKKPSNNHPYPIVYPLPHNPIIKPSTTTLKTTLQPQTQKSTTPKTTEKTSVTTEKNTNPGGAENSEKKSTQTQGLTTTEKTSAKLNETIAEKPEKQIKRIEVLAGKEESSSTPLAFSSNAPTITILPSDEYEDAQEEEGQKKPTGEIVHSRRCSSGYSRDKKGRCRRLRRYPQLPFGLTRFASNLAARFRQNVEPSSE